MKILKSMFTLAIALSIICLLIACDKNAYNPANAKGNIIETTDEYTKALKEGEFEALKIMSENYDEEFFEELENYYDTHKESNDVRLTNVVFDYGRDNIKNGSCIRIYYKYDSIIGEVEDTLMLEFRTVDNKLIVVNSDEIIKSFYENTLNLQNDTDWNCDGVYTEIA